MQRLLGGLPMREVLTMIQCYALTGRHYQLLDNIQLLKGRVLILAALKDKQRGLDVCKAAGDLGKRELRVEPGVAPSIKSAVHIRSMMLYQAIAERAALPMQCRGADTLKRSFLNQHMWGESNCSQYPGIIDSGVRQGDRSSIAVTQKYNTAEAQSVDNAPKLLNAMLTQEVKWPRQFDGARLSISLAAVNDDRTARSVAELFWKVAPLAGAAQAFMEQHKGWKPITCTSQIAIFDMNIIERQELRNFRCFRSHGYLTWDCPLRLNHRLPGMQPQSTPSLNHHRSAR